MVASVMSYTMVVLCTCVREAVGNRSLEYQILYKIECVPEGVPSRFPEMSGIGGDISFEEFASTTLF